jgi:hypothetical protein
MGFVVKQPSRDARAIFFLKLGRAGNIYISVKCINFFKGLSNPDLTPQKFVRGCLTPAHVNFLKIAKPIVMHPLASI